MLLVVPIVIFQVAIASVAAYSFTRWRGKIRSGIFFFYVILMLMPYQVTLVPNYLVSKWLGILNTSWAIILPGVFAPFSVFLLTKFMRRIPYSLIEAAKVDGAGEWQIFTRICLPQQALFQQFTSADAHCRGRFSDDSSIRTARSRSTDRLHVAQRVDIPRGALTGRR